MDAKALLERITANGMPMSAGGDLTQHLVAQSLLRPDQAPRAVAEYARFLALKAAGVNARPAPVIEEIWQEHLKDSAAYFDQFCTPVFGRPIHHAIWSQIGGAPLDLVATRAAYRSAFGAEPPDDIWPTPERMRSVRAWQWLAAGGFFVGACGYIFERNDLFWFGALVVLVGVFGGGLRSPMTTHREGGSGGDGGDGGGD
jgi:hypothetical protein